MDKRRISDAEVPLEDSDDDYTKVFTQRLTLRKFNETVKRYILDPALGKTLAALAGVLGMRVWHDQALIKEPLGNPTGRHLDHPYWSFHSPHAISIRTALDEVTHENGCPYCIPGSQKLASYNHSGIGQNIGDLFKVYFEFAQIDPLSAPLRTGSCSVHNGLCAHGAGANMTRGHRLAMTCAYLPEGSTFNGHPNILPKSDTSTLQTGDVLESEGTIRLLSRGID